MVEGNPNNASMEPLGGVVIDCRARVLEITSRAIDAATDANVFAAGFPGHFGKALVSLKVVEPL
ncbi:MAG: hypothetical protein P8Z80_02420 [Pseudolabrys sp.]